MEQNTVRIRLYKYRVLLHSLYNEDIMVLVTPGRKQATGRGWEEVQANKLKQLLNITSENRAEFDPRIAVANIH